MPSHVNMPLDALGKRLETETKWKKKSKKIKNIFLNISGASLQISIKNRSSGLLHCIVCQFIFGGFFGGL